MKQLLALFLAFACANISPAFAREASGPVPSFVLPSELRTLPQPMSPTALNRAGFANKEIAITIDDGPSPTGTPQVLKTLREHGVKATFFLVGKNAQRYPELVKDILREGHSIANHSWDHPNLTKISLEKAEAQITSTNAVLGKIASEAGYKAEPFFRFPEGAGASDATLKGLLRKHNMANFHWAMSAHDSRTKDPQVALDTSIGMIDKYKKGIFLMHETHPAGVGMLPYFPEELYRRGYKTIYFRAE